MFERYKIIHFIGIGGIGMSGIAEVLFNLGYDVTGSDLNESATTERLRGLGLKVNIGHRAENIGNAHVAVVSSAVDEKNPEVIESRRRGIPVIPRAEMLAELGRLKYAVLVAGSHGKTTTTSLIATILAHAGFDPTVVIGGRLNAFGTNARLGRGEFMVAEADESDGSFLKLSPTIAVVTNIDREHMEHFKTMQALKESFLTFMNKVPFYGLSVLCADDPNVRELLPGVHRKTLTYGMGPDAALRAERIKKGFMNISFDAVLNGQKIGGFTVPMSGEHNVLNSLAAIAAALELKIGPDKVKEALEGFKGIHRRLELKGEERGIKVYDDYGHHPTEIVATIKGARDAFKSGNLIVVFQPHRYTRTRDLMAEFASAFDHADMVAVMDIYPAGEQPIEGVDTAALMKIMRNKNAEHVKSRKAAVEFVIGHAKAGDVVITLGAGDVWKVGEKVLKALKNE